MTEFLKRLHHGAEVECCDMVTMIQLRAIADAIRRTDITFSVQKKN